MVGSKYEREADLFASCLLVDDRNLWIWHTADLQ